MPKKKFTDKQVYTAAGISEVSFYKLKKSDAYPFEGSFEEQVGHCRNNIDLYNGRGAKRKPSNATQRHLQEEKLIVEIEAKKRSIDEYQNKIIDLFMEKFEEAIIKALQEQVKEEECQQRSQEHLNILMGFADGLIAKLSDGRKALERD